ARSRPAAGAAAAARRDPPRGRGSSPRRPGSSAARSDPSARTAGGRSGGLGRIRRPAPPVAARGRRVADEQPSGRLRTAARSVPAGLSFAQPWPLALVIDTVLGGKGAPWWVPGAIGDGKVALILTAVGASVAVTLLSGALTVVNEYVMTSVHLKTILDLRSK